MNAVDYRFHSVGILTEKAVVLNCRADAFGLCVLRDLTVAVNYHGQRIVKAAIAALLRSVAPCCVMTHQVTAESFANIDFAYETFNLGCALEKI